MTKTTCSAKPKNINYLAQKKLANPYSKLFTDLEDNWLTNIQFVSKVFSRPNQNRPPLECGASAISVSPSKAVRQCWSVVGTHIFVLQTLIIKMGLCFSEHIGHYKLVLGSIWTCAVAKKKIIIIT